jgi:hypothetical protein
MIQIGGCFMSSCFNILFKLIFTPEFSFTSIKGLNIIAKDEITSVLKR